MPGSSRSRRASGYPPISRRAVARTCAGVTSWARDPTARPKPHGPRQAHPACRRRRLDGRRDACFRATLTSLALGPVTGLLERLAGLQETLETGHDVRPAGRHGPDELGVGLVDL